MRTLTIALLFVVCSSSSSQAQPSIDRQLAPLPTAGERKAADLASWGTAIAAVVVDATASWRKDCSSTWDHCEASMVKAGVRVGVTYGAAFLVKQAVHRLRPCAPSCGSDNPDFSFYSAHTALAFSTVGGGSPWLTLPLSIGTGGLRIAAGKHWLTDTLVGAGAGLLTSRIR